MQNRRRRLYLRSAFRLKLARYMITLVIFALVVLGLCLVFFFLWNPVTRQMLIISDPYAQSTARIFSNSVRILFAFFFALNFIFLWLTFLIARRVIGPFVRINRVLEQLIQGEIPDEVRFRNSDEAPFQELTKPLNQFIQTLTKNKSELEKMKEDVEVFFGKVEETKLPDDAAALMGGIRERLEKLA